MSTRLSALAWLVAAAALAQPQPPSLEPLYRQALQARETSLGPKHPKVAESLVDLALFLQRQGQPTAAEPLLLRAGAIYESTDSKAFAAVLAKLSELTVEDARAEKLLRQSLKAHATYGTASRLADLRERAGDLNEAAALYNRAIELASTPTEIAAASNNLGLLLEGQGRSAEAEPLFHRAAALFEKALGRDHPEFATALVNLAGTVRARGDLRSAAGMLRNAWTVLGSSLGSSHPHTQAACERLASVLTEAGNTQEAEAVQRRCR